MRLMRITDPDGVLQRQRRRLRRRLYKSKVYFIIIKYVLMQNFIGTQLHMAYGWVSLYKSLTNDTLSLCSIVLDTTNV